MSRVIYPAVFHAAEDGGYWVTFPDFEYVFSEGKTINESYEMAIDALFLAITTMPKGERLPVASAPDSIKKNDKDTIVLIDFDIEEYSRRQNLKAVRKTLSIPGWLNEAAISAGINFSAVLQKGLKEELGLI